VIFSPAFFTFSQRVTTRKLSAVLLGVVAALSVPSVATAASLCPFAVTSATQTNPAKFAIDALVLVRHALQMSNSTLQNGTGGTASLATLESNIAANRLRWDVDGDNDFTVTDAIIIARYLAGFSPEAWIAGLTFATNAQRKTPGALKQFIIDDGCPAAPSGFTGAVLTAPTGKISFRVDQAGKVSLAVYDSSGQMVRTLLNAVQYAAGTHTVDWNGENDAGTMLSAGSYGFKLLQTPGLSAEYLMTLQTTLPIGSAWNSYTNYYGSYPLSEDAEVGIGNHVGPTAITADASGIYVSSGGSETTSQMVKLLRDGSKRVWSAAQPDVSMGRYAMAVMGGTLYSLQQNGWLSYQGVNEPNFPSTDVGIPGSPNTLGARWNAQWPGSTRAGADEWATYSGAPMDMTASDAGGTAQLVLSYFDHNTVQWRNPATGAILDSVAITAPRGVALDSQGRLWVATEGRVVRLSRVDKTLVTIVSGLSSPYRITIDPTNDDILVAERGTDQRVKRFSSSGAAKASYGRLGGRQDGLYIAADFRNITDISPDGSGGFFITEHAAPRRIAQFNSAGNLVREWYAGATWAPFAYPEPGNPSVVWAVSERFLGTASTNDVAEFVRLTLDFNTKTWAVHSTYRLSNMGNSLVSVNPFTFGAGLDTLRPRRVNGTLFLAQDAVNGGSAAVLRVDEANWTIKPAAVLEFRGDTNGNFVWTDANGDGLAQESEIKRYSPGANEYSYYAYSAPTLRSDHALNYFSQGIYGRILRFPVASFNAIGNPVFAPLASASNAAWAAHPPELLKPNGESNIYGANHSLTFALDGSVYGAFGIGDRGWSATDAGLVARWDANGKLLWKRSLRSGTYDSGHVWKSGEETWSTFRNNVGVVRDSMVAQDFNGGNLGYSGQAITYAWDRDGLYVGGLFDTIDTSKVGKRWYNLGSENGAGAVIEEPGSDHVIYFGSTESANHVYRIKGWSGWLRLNGQVQRP
jgi:hypothetical protein